MPHWKKSLPLTYRLHSDLETNWNKSTVILHPGEIVFCAKRDGNIEIKVGDGQHTYSELPELTMHNLPDHTWVYFDIDTYHIGRSEINLINPQTLAAWREESEEVDMSVLDDIL